MEEKPSPRKPGILVRGIPPDKSDDYEYTLELYFDKFGTGEESVVKEITVCEDKTTAYVEFKDPEVLTKVLARGNHKLFRTCPVTVEKVDLLDVWQPYLTVKDIPPFVREAALRLHFTAAASGAEIQTLELQESGLAVLFYEDSKVALEVASKEQKLFGRPLTIEVSYCSPRPREESVLVVRSMPEGMDGETFQQALEMYLNASTEQQVDSCKVINDAAYVRFRDPSGVKAVASQPRTEDFMAGVTLEMSSIPISQVPSLTRERSPPMEIPSQSSVEQYGSVNALSPPRVLPPSRSPRPGTSPVRGQQSATWATHVPQPSPTSPRQAFSNVEATSSVAPFPGFQQPPGRFPGPAHDAQMEVVDLDFVDVEEYPPDPKKGTPNEPFPTGVTKVVMENFPPTSEPFVLKLYLQSIAQPAQCTAVEVRDNGKALATFDQEIDIDLLIQRARLSPFPDNQVPVLRPLGPTTTILVSNLPPQTAEFVVKLYFSHLGCSVQEVMIRPPHHAVVTFKDVQSVQTVMSQPQLLFDSTPIIAKEFFLFLDTLPPSTPQTPTHVSDTEEQPHVASPPPAKHIWGSQKKKIKPEREHFLRHTLPELNKELQDSSAHASMENESGVVYLIIKPLPEASDLHDWEERVTNTVEQHFADFRSEECSLSPQAKGDILQYTMSVSREHPELFTNPSADSLIVAGRADVVDSVVRKVNDIGQAAQVVETDLQMPSKAVKYLMKFCSRELQSVPEVTHHFRCEEGCISVRANPMALQRFQDLIDEKSKEGFEETVLLLPEAFKLLSTKKGQSKIEDAIPRSSRLVYEFEEVADGQYSHQICFLSPDKKLVREAAKIVEQFTMQKALKLSKQRLNICESSDRDWVECKERLTREFFILITVSSDSVIVTGESIALQGEKNVLTQIKHYLDEKVSVDDTLDYKVSEWKVVRGNMKQKIDSVREQARQRNVTLDFPRDGASKATFRIKGEPAAVLDIKTQLEMLKADLQVKEEKVSDVPGLMLVLQSLEDKLRVLEQTHKAVIEVDIESGENGASPTATARSIEERPVKILTATCNQYGNTVTVSMGDFTQPSTTGTIINFLSQSPNYRVGCLKTIIDAGGPEVQREIQTRVSQSYLRLRYAQVLKTRHGQLKCSQLVHCVIPVWVDGNQAEAEYLDESLSAALKSSAHFGSVVIVPATSKPFDYPVSVFAGKVVEAVVGSPVEVTIFIEDVAHATEFEKSLQANDFQVVKEAHRKPPSAAASSMRPHSVSGGRSLTASATASARSISSDLSTFITLSKGSILDVQADIYVNSTNTDMDLSNGKLGSVLLKACGKELQDECKQYAPLQPGSVAVTGAKNVKCKKIFHVALPDYRRSANPERVFRETLQKLLRAGETERASSIAFPSLGVAGLSYPPEVSAKILFDEVIQFHARNPSVVKMFHFVIYETPIHQVFTKVYAQRMTSDAPALQAAAPVHHRADKQVGNTQLQVVLGNIADATTDVIVNTTAEDMNLQANAVSRAISKKAGPKLQSVCKNFVESGLRLEQGNIAVTQACGQLSCKKVIHAHIPVRDDAIRASIDPKQLIDKIVTSCLKKADDDGMRSISFPAFGTGAGGYDVEEIAESMLLAFQQFGKANPKSVQKVQVVIYEQDQHDKFHSVFCKFFGQPATTPTQSYGIIQGLKATFGMGSQSKGISVNLQDPKSRTHSVIGPTRGFSLGIRPSSLACPVAVFTIFAATPQTAEQIVTAIRGGIKERVGNEEIDEEEVQFLLEDDIEDMVRLGDDLGVVVKYMPKVKKISISGERSKVSEAKLEIIEMMRDIERAKAELQIYQWQTLDDSGATEAYPDAAAVRLERAHRKNSMYVEMAIDNIAVLIDLQRMTESSKDTGITREVQRVKKTAIVFPATWEDQPKGTKGPLVPCHMPEIPDTSQEYQDAVRDFMATMGTRSFTIVKVQRIQNPNEYTRHCAFRETLKQKYGRAVTEKKVFHGTKEESMKAICHQGFNRIFAADANAAVLGKGVYFATNADYSAQDKYSAANQDGHKHMFVCNLLVGEFTRGSREMKVPPPLPWNPLLLHDTLVDRETNPTIYVAVSDSQAYPEYLITFKL